MCRTLLRSVFAFSWAVARTKKSGLGSKFGVVLVSLLISPLCLAATSSDTRNQSVECYTGTDWTTRNWRQSCGSALPGILGCSDTLTACGGLNPPVNSSATNTSVSGTITQVKYQNASSNQVCGRVATKTHCWSHYFNGTQTSIVYRGVYPDNDADSLIDDNDLDDDRDGVPDISDNCVLDFNADQLNTDGDSEGNACDSDDDNDGVADVSDAFPLDASESADTDGDGIGNNSDLTPNGDTDNDGIDNLSDNCAAVSNVDQLNTDGDSEGNACDSDDDNDGVADASDAFPLDASESADTDGDGVGNNSDPTPNGDTDNDGIDNLADNCASVSNSNQLDWDGNGIGDACDAPVPVPSDVDGTAKAEKTGAAVAFAGDFNGDGYGDYVIGSPGYSVPAAPPAKAIVSAGKAEVISGKDGSVLAAITGNAAKDAMGFAVAGNADVDNDGFADVVVGAPNVTVLHVGSVTVLYGGSGNRRHTFWGAMKNTSFGSAVALGDVDGDGHADVIIGAPKDNSPVPSQKVAGSVTVYDGNTLQSSKRFYGQSRNAHAGTAIATGDVDGDGTADIIVGAPDENGVGSVRVYNHSGTELLQKLGTNKKAQFGKAVASADINHDGYADIVVGAPLDDDFASNKKDTGSATVFSGINGAQLAKKYGSNAKVQLGYSVAAGDVNGDNKADIIAGAWRDNKPTANPKKPIKMAGSVSVFSGDDYAQIGTTKYGDAANDYFSAAVGAGDINSDGKADVIIGVPSFDLPIIVNGKTKLQKDAGKVTVINGSAL